MDFNTYRLRKWSNYIRIRDGKICQCCLNKYETRDLQAHHIKPKKDYPEFAYDLDNGITLCRDCHLGVIHSDDRNVRRFNMFFYPYMRRLAVKDFNDNYQSRI